jgi:hypothetical protein
MKIDFKGTKLTEFMRGMLNDSIYYYAHTLLTLEEMENLEILCKFTSTLHSKAKARVNHDVKEHRNDTQFKFTVDLPKVFELNETLESLAHEMIHIKQAVRGELVFMRKGKNFFTPYWKNVLVTETYYLADVNLPWEREAYRDTKELLDSFLLFWNARRLKGLK